MTTPSRDTLERRADRLGLELTTADRQTRMDAANALEPLPRWQLHSARNPDRSSVRGYRTLGEVDQALLERGISSDRQDLNPVARKARGSDIADPSAWKPGATAARLTPDEVASTRYRQR